MNKSQPIFVGKKVLLIDDDLTQLKLLEGLLKKLGFSVSSFQSPIQALISIDPDFPPDLIITDIYMPEINGWELCHHLRSNVMPHTQNVPILIVSSVFLGDAILRTTLEAGADAFIDIPLEPEKLIVTIQEIFEKRKKEIITYILWVAPRDDYSPISISNYKIEYAENIKQSIKFFNDKEYDLVVISHKLPEDPTPLIKQTKDKNKNIIIIAVLSEFSKKDSTYWLGKGVSAIIKEPALPEHIINLYEKIKLEKTLIQTKEQLERKIRESLSEELKWAAVLDALPSGVFIKDKDLKYIRVNKTYAGFFNKIPQEFAEIKDSELFKEAFAEKFISICKNALKGEIYQNPDLFLYILGEDRYFNTYIAPFKDVDGKIIGIFGTLFDVTELRKLQGNYKNLFETMQEAFAEHEFIYDEHDIPIDYRFLVANKAFEKMTGLKLDDIIGKTVREVIPDLKSFWILTYAQVVNTGNPVTFEMFLGPLNRHYLVHAFKTGSKRFACVFTDITKKKQFEEEIKRLNREWQLIYDNINSVIWFLNTNFEITRTNNAVIKIFKLTPDEVIGKKCCEIMHHTKEPPSYCPALRSLRSRKREVIEFCDNDHWYEVVIDPVISENNELVGFIHILSEITERKRAEDEKIELQKQLIQSQKLESIGRLAGGIAHDFNNMLSVIMGNIELAILKTEDGESIKDNLEEVHKAVERASEITKKILAFARKQDIQPKVLNLNDEIKEYINILKRVIPERIEIEFIPYENLWNVYLDPAHLDIILLNLCSNAKDAIPYEGKITIEVANSKIDETFTRKYPEAFPGDFVRLRVTDTGMGIPDEILPKIFDPFFTTKKEGEGTGLGLATVYGTVKQNNGFITVDTEFGKGTSFTIYFPRYKKQKEEITNKEKNNILYDKKKYSGTVLVVDDEKSVLDILKQIISRLGFDPVLTDNPIEALQIAEEYKSKIKLLISDMVLPRMNGFNLAREIKKIIPTLRTLFISGYLEELDLKSSLSGREIHLIKKPFTIKQLTQKIQEVMEGDEEYKIPK